MPRIVYRYQFVDTVDMEQVQTLFDLAMQAAISLYGESRVRLDARFSVGNDGRRFLLDANTDIGRALAFMFTGFLRDYLGDEVFTVQRASRPNDQEVVS